MSKQNIVEMDIFYLSYDEPKKDQFWADLQYKCPWAKRIDGVKGFDNAHKACARASSTSHFITVDGDNIVDTKFFDDKSEIDDLLDSTTVYSFSAKNMINGLIYGNGGIKIWPKQLVLDMRTHENAEDERSAIEFCWQINYKQMNNCYSEVWPNGSPLQAFRSGYREGVKMSLAEGFTVDPTKFEEVIFKKNLQRLMVWATVGKDVENGDWAVYGARLGCASTNLENQPTSTVRDYDWFNDFWKSDIQDKFKVIDGNYDKDLLESESLKLGNRLRKELNLDIAEFDEQQSKFFKKVFVNPLRLHPTISEATVQNSIPKEFQ